MLNLLFAGLDLEALADWLDVCSTALLVQSVAHGFQLQRHAML